MELCNDPCAQSASHVSTRYVSTRKPSDDNVVDVYVRYLRKKLENVKSERIIQTIRGIGFALRQDEQ